MKQSSTKTNSYLEILQNKYQKDLKLGKKSKILNIKLSLPTNSKRIYSRNLTIKRNYYLKNKLIKKDYHLREKFLAHLFLPGRFIELMR